MVKKNRTLEGRRELWALSMNTTTNRTESRKDILFSKLGIVEDRQKVLIVNLIKTIDTAITENVLTGIIDGDGSFYISVGKKGKIQTGFSIVADSSSRALLEGIQKKFNGKIKNRIKKWICINSKWNKSNKWYSNPIYG